ncbi:hypothetical protein V8E53_008809 [Lactarius tabidus]
MHSPVGAVLVTWIFNGCAMLTNDGMNATLWQFCHTWESMMGCPHYTSASSTPPFATRGIWRRLLGMQPYQHCGCLTFSSLVGFIGPARNSWAANKETRNTWLCSTHVLRTPFGLSWIRSISQERYPRLAIFLMWQVCTAMSAAWV